MRYITNADGYLVTVSFGGDVECDWGICTEYGGRVPTGYTSLEAWYVGESEKLHRWKVVDGQLTRDEEAPVPPQCNSWVDRIYPVGSLYLTMSPADPADLFGGAWRRIEDTFLLAAGSTYAAGTTGGEAAHTLTVEELPAHSHGLRLQSGTLSGGSAYSRVASGVDPVSGLVGSTGGDKPHNNMPPYLAVYVWQRLPDSDGGLIVTDDGAGNVTVEAYGTATITDDGNGNVTIWSGGATEWQN